MNFSEGSFHKGILVLLGAALLVGGVGIFLTKQEKKEGSTTFLSQKVAAAPLAHPLEHVVIVVGENERYSDVIGNTRDMPYLNNLANTYAYAKNYYADTHPSMGNYFMLTAGKVISNDDKFSGVVTDDNVVRHLLAAGKTWKEYSEGIPEIGYTGGDTGDYTAHHNPLGYFSDVRGQAEEEKNLVPFSQFASDRESGSLPSYSFVVPDNRHNGHDCPSGGVCMNGRKLSTFDTWLKDNIDPLITKSEFASPGSLLVVITFDESNKSDKENKGGHTAWVVVGPDVKRGYVSSVLYQHESTLRFLLEALGLTDFPGAAASAPSMTEFLNVQ